MKKEPASQKVLILGIDGMDPRLTKKYLDEGKLPNISKFLKCGVAREDLYMLGVLPTITPPSWTTLSTGAYPETHGITDFFRQSPEDLDTILYNLDSRYCKAEHFWDVSSAEGKKTLVWHWPGSAWPPTSGNPNLHVVDGTNPVMVNQGVALLDWEKIVFASEKMESIDYRPKGTHTSGGGCLITDLEAEEDDSKSWTQGGVSSAGIKNIILSHDDDGDTALERLAFDLVNSPIKEAKAWYHAPQGAKEFTVVTSNGLTRRPALILKNEKDIYDTVAIFKSKKEPEPYVVVKHNNEFSPIVLEEINIDSQQVVSSKTYKIIEMADDGSEVKLWMSDAIDVNNDSLWQPKYLYHNVIKNVGYIPSLNSAGGTDPVILKTLQQPTEERYTKWQADVLNYLIEEENYDVVFSHLHNIDHEAHSYWAYCKNRDHLKNNEDTYQHFMENLYIDTDRYIGRFLHLLKKSWSIIIVSDHGLVVRKEAETALLADPTGVMVPVMAELGYTVVKKDKNGNRLKEIDWKKTKAINTRGNFIWLNLMGRNKTGIVDVKDKEALEKQIISDLYNYRDPKTGKRMVSMALRNKDATLIGLSGPETGDIIFFIEEDFVKVHGDGLPTAEGYANTSLSPIFMAAGSGFKKGMFVSRVIREVDIAPTIALLTGTKVPAQCEGGVLYQLLEEDV